MLKVSILIIVSFLFITRSLSEASQPKIRLAFINKNNNGKWLIKEKFLEDFKDSDYIAKANYTIGLESIGWDLLAISTNKLYTDEIQAEAAGRLEGFLTIDRIWNHWRNLNTKQKWDSMPENIRIFFEEQEAFIDKMYKLDPEDGIFANAYFLLKQLQGLRNSYLENCGNERRINLMDFHTMTSFGDLFDVQYYNNRTHRPDFSNWSTEKISTYILLNNHCSALFKVKEDFSDIFFGHNSWFHYSAMNRIFKEYNFNFNHESVKSRNILFSSYPATLASMDDFYVTSQDLVIIETTNSFFNNELYDLITPKSLLTWQRAMIASRISDNSKEWTEKFAKNNSGTYNNQFMVLDMKKVDLLKHTINKEAMHIIEQIPGTVEIIDITNYLNFGYWPSYNTPFSFNIRNLSKIDEMIEKRPDLQRSLDYNSCARANIFRRDQGKCSNIEQFQKLIRYNDYNSDPLSLNDPTLAIACRADLSKSCMGAYDAKASSVKLAKGRNKTIKIISGPTNENLPKFSWNNSQLCRNDPHFGLPNEYQFVWYNYSNIFYDEKLSEILYFLE